MADMDLSFQSRKRGRDDDDDDEFGIRIEGVPADKKQRNAAGLQLPPWLHEIPGLRPSINRAHTLPFRLDHGAPPPPPALFETIEADESPTDSSSGNSPASSASPELADVEMNIDHQISIAGSASPPSPFRQPHPHLLHRPDKLNPPGLDTFSGRIPTPIHSNFNLALQHPSLLASAVAAPPRSRTDSFLPAAAAHMNALPRFAAPMKHILETDYAMPSPIAESPLIEEDDDDADADAMHMEMSDFPSSQLSRLSVSQDGIMDVDERALWSQHSMMRRSSSSISAEGLAFDVTPPTPTTPGRTGRARSGAFSASSAPADKGGRRVVFGYREDCEKCRMRFPGHFAHFV